MATAAQRVVGGQICWVSVAKLQDGQEAQPLQMGEREEQRMLGVVPSGFAMREQSVHHCTRAHVAQWHGIQQATKAHIKGDTCVRRTQI